MALTDTALRELHRRAKKGEDVPMKSDGAASTFRTGNAGGYPIALQENKRRWPCILTCL